MKTNIRRLRDGRIKYTITPHHELEMGGVSDDALGAAERAFAQLDAVASSPLGVVLGPEVVVGAKLLRKVIGSARRGAVKEELEKLAPKARHAAEGVLHAISGWLS